MKAAETKAQAHLFPVYFKHVNREDYYKIESLTKGHFIRNLQTPQGGYCYQSNDIKEVEIGLVLKSDSSELIDAKVFKEALKNQSERNSRILEKLAKE